MEKALVQGHPKVDQRITLFLALNTLSNQRNIQLVAYLTSMPNDRASPLRLRDLEADASVEFDDLHRVAHETVEIALACAKVIQRELYTHIRRLFAEGEGFRWRCALWRIVCRDVFESLLGELNHKAFVAPARDIDQSRDIG